MLSNKDKYEETFETWNKVAQLYQDTFMGLDLYNSTYELFCKEIKNEKASVLEIGCGPGNITKYILDKQPSFILHGIDVAPNMISLAKKNNPSAKFTVMDCRKIIELQETFDAVVAGFCIPYLSENDCEILIHNVSNILNKGGVFYLSFVEGVKHKSGYQTGSSGDRVFFYFHGQKNIVHQLKTNNFEAKHLIHKTYTRSNNASETHTIIIAQKQN